MSDVDQAEEFERLRLRLELTNLRIARLYLLGKGQAAQSSEGADPLEELYVSDSEFQGHLSALAGLPPTWVDNPDVAESLEAIDGALEVVGRRVQFRTAHARRQGRLSRFEHLCERCELSDLDQEILLIALAPEVDRRYRRVFAYLHDDFTRGIPSVGLVVDVLAPLIEGGDRLATLSRFESGSSLIRRGLVELLPARADDVRPLSQRHLRVSDDGREAGDGWSAGAKTCTPPDTQRYIMGNVECWIDGFDYSTCCDPKFGPNGNSQCWDGMFNYNRCCFPRYEL